MNKNSHTDNHHPDEFLENLVNVKQVFLSFAAKISPVNFNLLLDNFANKSNDVFYFNQPDKGITFLSFDELTIQTYKSNDFSKITSEIKLLKNKLISNHNEFPGIDFPVFLTCSKFPTNKSAEEWNDFGEIDFLIPKISLFKHYDSYFLLYNILTESFSSHENLNEVLENHAEKIYQLESKLKENINSKNTISFIEESDDKIKWDKKVSDLIKSIKQNEIEKVVLARRLKFSTQTEINWQFIFNELDKKYPNCTNFLLKSGESIFFGSTPELLAGFTGNQFYTEALAGSIMRGTDEAADNKLESELLNSKKNNIEHYIVINHIKSSLQNLLEKIEIDDNPTVKKFSNIQHLQTSVKGMLKKDTDIFDIISALFPTPAVCGVPKEKSLQLIGEMEEFDRGLYSGLIGWFDCKGNGEFNVTIRSALINKNILYTYAGCGIVEDSNPAEEFEETVLKFKPILSLFDNAN